MGAGKWLVTAALLLCGGAEAQAQATPWYDELDWRLSANVQGDGLVNSNLAEDRQKNTELRRARLGGQLVMGEHLRLSASGDFSDNARLRDLYLEVRSSSTYYALGRFPEPFGLAAQESSRTSLMMERPQPTAIGPGYGLGIAMSKSGVRWGLTLGLFNSGGQLSDEDALKGRRQEDAFSLRYTGTGWRTVDRLAHFGFSVSARRPNAETLRFVAIPETIMVKGLQTSSGVIPVEDQNSAYLMGSFETAFANGPFLMQAEYIRAEPPALGVIFGPLFQGYYLETGYVLTGERRPYSTRRGVFGPISPGGRWDEGNFGAWEIAARYSETDFSSSADWSQVFDEETARELGIVQPGGRGTVASLGLNWYPSAETRVSVNGLRIDKRFKDGDGNDQRESANVVQMRLYLQFDLPRRD